MKQKKGSRLLRVLKLLGLLGGFLLVYPLCYLAWFLTGAANTPLSLLAQGTAVLCGVCGAGLRVLLERRARRLTGPALAVCGLLLAAGSFFLFGAGLLPGVPVAAACLAAFVIGDRLVILPYDAAASRFFFVTALASYLLGGTVLFVLDFSFGFEGSYLPLALMLFAVLAIHELACNQAQIDFLMQRRGHRMDQLPSRIRRYNLALVLLILLVILCGLLFYRPIGSALLLIGEVLRQAVILLLRGIGWLMSLFTFEESSGEEAVMEPQEMFPMEGEESGANSDWVIVVLFLLLVALAVWKRREILAAIRRTIAALWEKLRGLVTVRRREASGEEEPGYFDTVEELSRERQGFRLFTPSAARVWKRDLRALRRLPEGSGKLRAGYALLARGLALTGVKVRPSDTPAELLALASSASLGPESELAVAAYEEVRYNDREATAAQSAAMQTLLAALARRI